MEKNIQNLINSKCYSEIASILNDANLLYVLYVLNNNTKEINKLIFNDISNTSLNTILTNIQNEYAIEILMLLEDDKLEVVIKNITLEYLTTLCETMPNDLLIKIITNDLINKFTSNKKYNLLKKVLININSTDLAIILETLEDEDQLKIFRLLPKDLSAETFVELDYSTQEDIINKLTDKELNKVLQELFIDDMADIVEEMPANVVKRILAQSDAETRNTLNEILKYPNDCAGSIMTVEFISFKPTMTVKNAIDKIRKNAIDKETIYTCYICDNTNKLIGYTSAKDLLIAEPKTLIKDIMNDNIIYSHTLEDKEDVARKISNYNFLAMPIVDDEMRLVGIVTIDDAIDVINEENTEDLAKMTAITPNNKPYLKSSIWEIWKNRVPWLLLLMISSTITGLIINGYESQLSAISSVLIACVPMIMGTGGNAGSQVSVTIIRSLAINELTTKDIFKAIWKELRVSILLGITLGVACFAKLMLLDNLIFQISDYTAIRCIVISIALTLTIIVAKLVGCILPLIAKKFHLDPAVVANPFITTIIDVVSLILYCSLAVSILA